ncbi:hypothetical protein FG379_000762 [Cryptosporidium bovis]|uniref:uncharacterized protein n=1 Tax=Cryptosporidium bovis TaxID=310047 RepID=UPI00351A0C13|nr:hypothetical protein FG379_000762 [Cryptosporidium bovis]
MRFLYLVLSLALLFFVSSADELGQRQLRRGSAPSADIPKIDKVGLFVEGFTAESIKRTKTIISVGLEGAEILELLLSDLQSGQLDDVKLFAAPSDPAPGASHIVGQGMAILAGFVEKGSLLFSQMSSSSILCEEFIYNGETTTNSPFIYEGQCIGPLTETGPFHKDSRAATIKISGREETNNVFVYGGFYFKEASQKENCIVLATITPNPDSEVTIEFNESADPEAVIVACKHGNGAAILSGVYIDQNKSFIGALLDEIQESEHLRNVHDALSEMPIYKSSIYGFLLGLILMANK